MKRKSGGEKLNSRFTKLVVLPRGNGKYLSLKVQAVLSFKPFHEKCVLAPPMQKMDKEGNKTAWTDDPMYKERLKKHNDLFNAWVVINSILNMEEYVAIGGDAPISSEEIVFETIDPEDPKTWMNWEAEMIEAGISQGERNKIVDDIMKINSLTDDSLSEALSDFLAMVQSASVANAASQKAESPFTPNGEPVKDSDSSLPETPIVLETVGTTSTQIPKKG